MSAGATPPTAATAEAESVEIVACTLWQYCAYFLRLGALGFGGPIALAGYCRMIILEVKKTPEPLVIVAAGILGLVLRSLLGGARLH